MCEMTCCNNITKCMRQIPLKNSFIILIQIHTSHLTCFSLTLPSGMGCLPLQFNLVNVETHVIAYAIAYNIV